MSSPSDYVYHPDAPPYTSFFGIVGVTAAMSFCGECNNMPVHYNSFDPPQKIFGNQVRKICIEIFQRKLF